MAEKNNAVTIEEQKALEIQGQTKSEKVENKMTEKNNDAVTIDEKVFTDKKATKKQKFGVVHALLTEFGATNGALEFIEHEIGLLDRKNRTKSKKEQARQTERMEEAKKIIELFQEDGSPKTLIEIHLAIGLEAVAYSNQGTSSTVRMAIEELNAQIERVEKSSPVQYQAIGFVKEEK